MAQDASWWYPLGNPEATRRVGAMLPASPVQDSSTLVLKWRSTKLKSSPVLLVGAIDTAESQRVQQVVGMERGSNVLTILSSGGRLLRRRGDYQELFGTGISLRLTGLFDSHAPSPAPTARPDVIGIGVERQQSAEEILFGVLVNSIGDAVRYLKIDRLEETSYPENLYAGVFPVAAYTGVAVAITSQDRYDGSRPGADTMVNIIRKYTIDESFIDARPQWTTPFAPRGYVQQPGILPLGGDVYLAPSNGSYDFLPPRKVVPPSTAGNQVETFSNLMYSFNYLLSGTTPVVVETKSVPPGPPQPGTATGHYVLQYDNVTAPTGTWRRLTTENHSPAAPGRARLYLNAATQSLTGFEAIYDSANAIFDNKGWTIVAADLDGSDSNSPTADLFRNKGAEVVGAFSLPGDPDIEANRLFLFRWNSQPPDRQDGRRFWMFASHPFSGRLMAGGDLVSDTFGRQELVVANGSQLAILQLRPYNDLLFGRAPNEQQRRPFVVLDTMTFDSRIVSAVIADLEGDGLNDIVVTTEMATYAIGRPPAQPFGVVTVSDTICVGEAGFIRWNRRVGDGDSGTNIIIRGSSDSTTLRQPAGLGDTIVIAPGKLQPGRYRVIIQDPVLPALVDSSRSIVVRPQSIARLGIAKGDTIYTVGSTVDVRGVLVSCAEDIQLQYSYDRTGWTRAAGGISQVGPRVSAETILVCPPQVACGAAEQMKVYFRLADSAGLVTSPVDSLVLHIPAIPINATPGTGSLSRRWLITWPKEEFSCQRLRITLEADGTSAGSTIVDRSVGSYDLEIPIGISGEITVRLCCESITETCQFGKATIFAEEADESNYIAPNPFDPERDVDGARILYSLGKVGAVTITIYDASRAVVRRLVESEEQEPGFHGESFWDGRNERGEIVANGTYICVIESSSGERILLQMIVVKH